MRKHRENEMGGIEKFVGFLAIYFGRTFEILFILAC